MLARALWASDAADARGRAVGLVEQARHAYREAGEAEAKALTEVEQWLREHGRGGAG